MTHRSFEDVHGVGPTGLTRKLDQDGGTRPTFKVIEKATGRVVIADDVTLTDPRFGELYERLPGDAP
jgi:hypothetical protein